MMYWKDKTFLYIIHLAGEPFGFFPIDALLCAMLK